MTYTVEALGDFMRVGPQVYPERPNAVQVVMRGPHGKRLAADPVRTREGAVRGSGFRTWIEQLNVPANESWNPPQKVVGLLGLGGSSEAPDSVKVALSKGARDAVVLSESLPDQAVQNFQVAVRGLAAKLDEYQKFDSTWLPYGTPGMSTWDSSHVIRENLQAANANLNRRLGKRDPASRSLGTSSADRTTAGLFLDNVASKAFVRDLEDRARECAADPLKCARNPTGGGAPTQYPSMWTVFGGVALLAVGGLAIYSFAGGLGKGLATRGLAPKET